MHHVLALKSDGSVVGWGLNDSGQATAPAGLTGAVGVCAGQFTSFVIKSDGSLLKWGGTFDSNDPPANLTGVIDVRAGFQHAIALRADGTAVAWGPNFVGQGAVPPGLDHVTAISAGGNHNLVLTPRPLVAGISPPVITNAGATVTFVVQATGAQLSYQWQHQGTNLPAKTEASITLMNVQPPDAGSYTVLVSNPYGTTTSAPALLQVTDPRSGTLALRPIMDISFYSSGVNPQGAGTILVGTRNNGIVDRGLLKFDLSSIPPSTRIQSARVQLTVVKLPRAPSNSSFSLYRMLTPWDASATWFNPTAGTLWAGPGTLAGADYSASSSSTSFITGGGQYDFGPTANLLNDVQNWLTNAASNNGWLIKSESEDLGRSARHFGSSESTSPPQLLIDYLVPAPSPTLTNIRIQSQTNFTFQLNGAPGWIYTVESRDNVDHGPWTTITNAPAGPATNPILISLPLTPPQGFYRVLAN
jgi:hypothetical protein